MEYKWKLSFHLPEPLPTQKHTPNLSCTAYLPLNRPAASTPKHTHTTHTLGLTNTAPAPEACHLKKSPEGNCELSLQFTATFFHSCHTLALGAKLISFFLSLPRIFLTCAYLSLDKYALCYMCGCHIFISQHPLLSLSVQSVSLLTNVN